MESKKESLKESAKKLEALVNVLQAIDDLIDSKLGENYLGDFLFDIAEEIYLISDEIKKYNQLALISISDDRKN